MPRTVSANEAETEFTSLLGWVTNNRDAVIVENQGTPAAVLIPYAE